jgi:hypothetical protein
MEKEQDRRYPYQEEICAAALAWIDGQSKRRKKKYYT